MTLEPNGYLPRLLDSTIERRMRGFGAVEVTGTKFCGKTWTSLAHAKSVIHLDDDATREMVSMQPNLALEGELPHVIDEWQDVPRIWDAVRRRVDETGNQCGQYLLTGSSTVDKSKIGHSGAGRIAKVHMRPMSLYESGTSDGRISLKDLFEGKFETSQVQTDLRDIARFICAGGWPAALGRNDDIAGDLPAQYLDATFSVSAPRCGLDPYETRKVAGSLARNLGKTLTYRVLYADVYAEEPPRDADNSALRQRLLPFNNFFKDQYFIEEQSGWDAPVKSRSRVRSKPKHTFADPSLPASLLAMTPERLLFERQLFGNLFEELCLRDIRVYTSAMGFTPDPEVRYYSDADGLEIDIVIELPDGRWGAFEVKLSDEKAPAATKNLLRLQNKVLANPAARNRAPSFLAVLVGKADFCRRTPEGVYVIPLTCLGA